MRTRSPRLFYGAPYALATLFHYGGLAINRTAQVLDNDNPSLPRLKAAGDVAMGSFDGETINTYGNHTGGIAIGCTFGLLSAEGAAERAKGTM